MFTKQPIPSPTAVSRTEPSLPRRRFIDRMAGRLFAVNAFFSPALVLGVLAALFLRASPILGKQSLWSLLLGRVWLPNDGKFGFLPFIMGTFWVTLVGVALAVPPCLLNSIYLSEYAHPAFRSAMKPVIDLLAAIPSVVYGVWGMVAIVPWIQGSLRPFFQRWLSFIPFFSTQNPTGFSILAGGIVLAMMVAPFMISVTYEVMQTVPNGVREAALALGATRWQAVKTAVLPNTLPGILAGVVLASSRALGETMAVVMVVGNVAQVPKSIFDAAYPLPALIANNYGEMMSIPLYDAALLCAALILLIIVLIFNVLSTLVLNRFIQRYKE